MDKSKIARHVARNYKKLNNGVSIRYNKKVDDVFLQATDEDKWNEFNSNVRLIQPDGYVWKRVLKD